MQGQLEDQGQKILSWECDTLNVTLKQNWTCIEEYRSHNEKNGQGHKNDTR